MKNATKIFVLLALLVGGYFVFRGSSNVARVGSPGTSLSGLTPSSVSGVFRRGEQAPDVSLTDFQGETHNLSDYRGRGVILDFWAAWCPFCLEEMPELQAAQDLYKDDLVIIGVHRTDTESASKGQKFATERGVTYLLASDTDGSLYRASGGVGMPTAIFIDSDGVVTEIKSGPKTAEEIDSKASALIK